MCTTPNLTNLATWNLPKPLTSSTINSSLTNFTYKPKPKLFNYPMTVVNNLNKPDDRGFSDAGQSKYFLAPLGGFQLTPEECNEILMKRASLAAASNTQMNLPDSCSNSSTVSNSSLQSTRVNSNVSQAKLRPYSCVECGKTFIQKHHLTTHKKVHSGIRPHTCNHCGKAFTHKHCLNTHLLLHSVDRPYECRECKKSFTLKHHLISHAKVHSREKPFICTDCGCAFPLKRHLVTHSKFHAGERPFICEECGESFAHKNHLVMHSRFHGSTNSFVCHDCGSSFTRKFELVNHSRLHGHIPLSCPVCNKEFLQKRTLVVHMRMHTSETPFTCVTCGEGFHLRNELNHHMATHDALSPGIPGKHLSCSECGSCFNNPEALALHVKLHSGDASFVNDLCTLTANLQSSSFPGHNNNNSHSNKSHVIKNENTIQKVKSHICKFCSRAFSAKHGLQQHNKRHPDGTCALKSHICDICNKAFYQKNHLLLHQRQHMDVSMRHPNYSKTKNNEDDNENIYEQHSQEPKSLSHNGNNKSLNSIELTSNANLTDKRPSYLSYYEAYTIPKYQTSAKPDSREPCSSESSPEERKEAFPKQHPLLHQRQHMDVNMRHPNYSKTKSNQDDNENIYEQHSQEPKSLSHNGNNKSLNSIELTSNANLTDKRPSYLSYYEGYTIPKYQTSPKPDNQEPCSSESSPEERKEAFSKNDCLENHSDGHRLENLRNVDAKMQISSEIIGDMSRSNNNKSLNPIELTSNANLSDKRPSYLSYYEDYTLPKYQASPKPSDNQEPRSSESSSEERKEAFSKNNYLENHTDSYRLENLRNVDVKMQISSEIISDINRSKNDDNFTVTSQTVVQ